MLMAGLDEEAQTSNPAIVALLTPNGVRQKVGRYAYVERADSIAEVRESISFQFTAPSGVPMPRAVATLAIVDRTTPTVSPVTAMLIPCRPFVSENAGMARLLVKRVGATDAALAIKFKTIDGSALANSDFVNTAGDLLWAAGNAEFKRIEVPLIDDSLLETPEHFRVQLTDSSGVNLSGLASFNIMILDGTDQFFNDDFSALCTGNTD
jgi:hypothetical protein